MKRLLVAALLAGAAATGAPTAHAVCAHSHGYPHAHSGSCSGCPSDSEDLSVCDAGVSIDNPALDRVLCKIASVARQPLIEC